MYLAEDFRKNAQRCFKLSQDALTAAIQAHWIDMAQLWLDLARHAEEHAFNGGGETSLVPEQTHAPVNPSRD